MAVTGRDLHVNIPLSNVAMGYRPVGMIADMVAPIVPVVKQSDAYLVWSQADALRIETDRRAPGTEANKIFRTVSSDTYYAQNYALKMALTLEDRENMDPAYIGELRNGRTTYITSKLILGWEKRLTDKVTSGSNVGSYATVASDWMELRSGYSDPLANIWTAMYNVEGSTGYKPNRIVMGDTAWRYFRKHADVIDILYGNSGQGKPRYATQEQMKSIFELDQFLVGGTYYNSAQEGQTASLSQLWGDYVLVYHAPMAASQEEPSFMYSFRWRRPAIPDMAAEVYPFDAKTKSEEIEVGYYQDEKITSANLAFLLTHVTSV